MGIRMKKTIILLLFSILCTFTLLGEEEELSEDMVQIGGEIWTSGGIAWEWDSWSRLQNPTDAYQYIAVDSAIWIEAHPADIVSAYGKALFSFEGSTDEQSWTAGTGGEYTAAGSSPSTDQNFTDILSDSFRIQTLYTRITPLPFLALSGGKRQLDWELGRYFSPADYINQETIDYTDPYAERNGPFAISAEVPVAEQLFLLHVILEDSLRPWEIAVAPQAWLQFGPVEARIGGKFQWNKPLYSSIGLATDVFLFQPFLEAEIEYFSDKKYITSTDEDVWPDGVSVETAPNTPIFTISTGTAIIADAIGLKGYVQYLFNTWGNFYRGNFGILAGRSTEILLEEGRISESDLYLPGLHYLALDVNWDIFETGLRLKGAWLINLQALSYRLDFTLGYSPLPFIDIALNVPIVLHDFAGEFGTVRNGWKTDFSVTLGTSF